MSMMQALIAVALAVAGAVHAAESDPPPQVERARVAAAELRDELKSALGAALSKGGVTGAIEFCATAATRITAEVAERHGVRMGRTALRRRNPGNAPEPWQREMLQSFAAEVAAGAQPASRIAWRVERDGAGQRTRVLLGIGTEAPCLACHGSVLAPDVRAKLAERYPDDQATGFAVGDLRGAIWVEVVD